MLKISITAIPHADHPYPTAGNYWRPAGAQPGELEIRVSRMADRRHEYLLALHELVEAILCEARGIDFDAITRFDIAFERSRADGDLSEPGEAAQAPYRAEHRVAEIIERIAAHELGVDWNDYSRAIARLD